MQLSFLKNISLFAICLVIFLSLFFFNCGREPFHPIPAKPAPPWIDDFNHNRKLNKYVYCNLIDNPDPSLTASFSTSNIKTGYAVHVGGAMEIGVSDNTNGEWFGFYSNFDSTTNDNDLGLNVSRYTSVAFRIKGSMKGDPSGGGLKIGLRAVGTPVANEKKHPITKYLSSGLSDKWQEIIAPFTDFSGVSGWSLTLEAFVIVFEDDSGKPTNGVIWIDDIRFLPLQGKE